MWRHLLFKEVPKKVFYIYATRNSTVDEMLEEGLIHKAIRNLPNSYEAFHKMLSPYCHEGVLLIVDDGLSQMEDYLPQLFEEYTSKNNTSIIFVSQATFLDSSSYRRLSDNSHYIIMLRNKRNSLKIRSLAAQAKPCNPQFVVNSYIDATKPKILIESGEDGKEKTTGYGYFIFDFSLSSPEVMNFRTNIFPNESEPVTLYIEKE